MIEKNRVRKILQALGVDYPRLVTDDLDARVELWYSQLKNPDETLIEQAALDVLRNCRYEPKLADIFDAMKKIRRAVYPSPDRQWQMLEKSFETPAYDSEFFDSYDDFCNATQHC